MCNETGKECSPVYITTKYVTEKKKYYSSALLMLNLFVKICRINYSLKTFASLVLDGFVGEVGGLQCTIVHLFGSCQEHQV